jgi:hypothetical protein
MRDECQEFLKVLGFVCFSCDNHEAEAMCANLSKQNRTTATVSEGKTQCLRVCARVCVCVPDIELLA